MGRKHFIQTSLAALISVFLALAGYVVVLMYQHQKEIDQLSNYNLAWIASQTAVEVTRFNQRVTAFAAGRPDVDEDEVQLRFDILVSRVDTLKVGSVREFVEAAPERKSFVETLDAAIQKIDQLMPRVAEPGVAAQISKIIEPFDRQTAPLASSAYAYVSEQVLSYQKSMRELQYLFVQIVAGLIACGAGLIVFLLYQNAIARRASAALEVSTRELRSSKLELEDAKNEVDLRNAELNIQNRTLLTRDIQLRTQNERFDAALNNMSHGLFMLDGSGRMAVCNARYLEIVGLGTEDLPAGVDADELRDDPSGKLSECVRIFDAVNRTRSEGALADVSRRFMHGCEDGRTLSVACQRLGQGGWIATLEDVTERRRAEARVEYMAHHDALTDLPNRATFMDAMHAAIGAHDAKGVRFALLSLDLDRFKIINDTLGHDAGDKVLQIVGQRLRDCVRDGDVVARFGGDEFAILQDNISSRSDMLALARRVIETISAPFPVNGRELRLGTSVGMTFAPEDGRDPEQLLKNADIALYRAKSMERGTCCFYEAEMDRVDELRLATEVDLRQALNRGELEIYYQPIASIGSGDVNGYEALLRWKHPVRGFISPAVFIPLAEDIGVITSMGEWVLRQACVDAASWPGSLNVSSIQLRNSNILATVVRALADSGLQPSRLILELTESSLIEDTEATMAILKHIRELGVKIALDDFGTGYSSLSYLRKFAFDKVKIDKSFVDEVTVDGDCLAIIESIVRLCSILKTGTTAEGVETSEQLEKLVSIGCTEVQGYLIDRPKPLAQILERMPGLKIPTAEAA